MVTPEFEKEFKELCEKYGVLAAFVTIKSVSGSSLVFMGGHRRTCEHLRVGLEIAQTVMTAHVSEKNATKH